jgi:hypothetical protein
MRRSPVAGVLLSLAGLAPINSLVAQEAPRTHAIELTMSAGYFQPYARSGQIGTLALTRKPAWAATTLLSFNAPSGMLSFEASTGYAAERISQGGMGSRGTHLMFGAARLMVGRNPRKSGISYMIGGGLSVIRRKKSVLDSSVGQTNLGGSASAMVRFPIDGQVGLRLDAQDLIYSADYGQGKKMRNDVVMSAGLSIAW